MLESKIQGGGPIRRWFVDSEAEDGAVSALMVSLEARNTDLFWMVSVDDSDEVVADGCIRKSSEDDKRFTAGCV